MVDPESDSIRHRELAFAPPHYDAHQARTAMLLLDGINGIEQLEYIDDLHLRIGYRIEAVSLRMIEEALSEVGFHLDNSLLAKLKRALYYYSEDVQRANLGCGRGEHNCIQKVFINRYQNLPHGCRDDRPEYWRRYW